MFRNREKRMSLGETGHRKKLYSLRFLNPKYHQVQSARHDPEVFKKLEKSLERDNREEQPVSVPTPELPDDEKDNEDDTLWSLFMAEAGKVTSKVSSQKVNCYQREFNRLKNEFQFHQKMRLKQFLLLQNTIKEKYKQIHCYFQQFKQQKQSLTLGSSLIKTKKNRKSQPLLIMQNSQKMQTLQQTIDSLRKEVEEVEKEISFLNVKDNNAKNEWIWFLRKMLKEGYYLKRGAIPILEEMAAVGFVPKIKDMPPCLDQVSKKCLLLEYEQIKSQTLQTQLSPKRILSEPKSKLKDLTEKQLMRDIYKQTKNVMSTLMKQPLIWKDKFTLPPISTSKKEKEVVKEDWKQHQKKRLSHVYTGEKYQISRTILFGPKVETQI